jgi:cell division protein FtsI (penicillin-binding protein 3)
MINPRPQSNSANVRRRSRKPLAQKKRSQKGKTGWCQALQQPSTPKATQPVKDKPLRLLNGRLLLVAGVLIAGILSLGWRLYQLQIVQAPTLQKKARQQQTVSLRPYIPRRSVIDSQGNILATDRLLYTLYVHPKLFKRPPEEMAAQLSTILDNWMPGRWSPQVLLDRFKQKQTGIRLVDGLTEELAKQITDLSLDGLELTQEYARFYPQQDLAANVIGYVDGDHRGQAGLEQSQRQLLEQHLLNFSIRRAGNGEIMPAFLPKDVLKFDDLQLQLTLDLRLQRAARAALKQQLKKFNAKRGAVIVMDANDGSLLSLVCEPTFDPNQYYKNNVALFKNWTVSDLYEPGSTFKPINIAIALNAGVIQPNTHLYDSGVIQVDGWRIFNSTKTGNGSIDIAKVLQTSSNVGMVQIMLRMPKHDYYKRLKELGLTDKVGIDLPGEEPGHLKSEAEFTSKSIEAATTAFGQGFSLTPMKLIQLHGALANGGKLVTPHVVRGLVDNQGHLHWKPSYPVKTVFSPQISHTVVGMMETVVKEGTGEPAKISGYRIGGKTGTAQKASPRGGYLSNAKITSFVGILPVNSPRYVVLAVVDEPQGGNTFGSTVAAPIVKSVMEALIAIRGIPPSH